MTPTAADRIVSFVAGELGPDETRTFEAELMAGRFDGADLAEISAVLVGIREAAYLGILDILVPPEHADRMRANGYRVAAYRLEPGRPLVAEVPQDVDLIYVEYVCDLEGVSAVTSELRTLDGKTFKRWGPIPLGGARALAGYCAADLALATARELPDGWLSRLYSVEPTGERLLGEYQTKIVLPRT